MTLSSIVIIIRELGRASNNRYDDPDIDNYFRNAAYKLIADYAFENNIIIFGERQRELKYAYECYGLSAIEEPLADLHYYISELLDPHERRAALPGIDQLFSAFDSAFYFTCYDFPIPSEICNCGFPEN